MKDKTSNEKLIQCIFDQLRDDDESAEKKGDKLKFEYNRGDMHKKETIDYIFTVLTGSDFHTLIKKSVEEI